MKLAEGMLGVDIGDDYSIWRQGEKLKMIVQTIVTDNVKFISSHDENEVRCVISYNRRDLNCPLL